MAKVQALQNPKLLVSLEKLLWQRKPPHYESLFSFHPERQNIRVYYNR